jgi:hypothetical protein
MSSDVTMEDLVASSTDCSSSDSEDSDLDELLHEDDTEMMMLILGMKEIEDRAKLLDQITGQCWVAFASRGTAPSATPISCKIILPRYQPIHPVSSVEGRSLFEKIVKDLEANSNYFKQCRNTTSNMGFSPNQKSRLTCG